MESGSRSFLLPASLCLLGQLWGQSIDKDTEARPTFRVGVEAVFVNVLVTDLYNRYIAGLEREHFRIYEDKQEQLITHFVQESSSISVGILFDISASMRPNIRTARNSVARFLEDGNPEDEFFLVNFNQKTSLAQGFTHQRSRIQEKILVAKPGGRTALYDALHLGLQHIKGAKNDKKALVLITDGEDNSSRYCASEVEALARESDAQIYALGVEGKPGRASLQLQKLVGITGGRAFFPKAFSELDYYIELIQAELRHHYILGYTPANRAHDGKWRRLQVKLAAVPEGMPKLIVQARDGYHAAHDLKPGR